MSKDATPPEEPRRRRKGYVPHILSRLDIPLGEYIHLSGDHFYTRTVSDDGTVRHDCSSGRRQPKRPGCP